MFATGNNTLTRLSYLTQRHTLKWFTTDEGNSSNWLIGYVCAIILIVSEIFLKEMDKEVLMVSYNLKTMWFTLILSMQHIPIVILNSLIIMSVYLIWLNTLISTDFHFILGHKISIKHI